MRNPLRNNPEGEDLILPAQALDREPHLLGDGAADAAADRVCLPARRGHDLVEGGAGRPAEEARGLRPSCYRPGPWGAPLAARVPFAALDFFSTRGAGNGARYWIYFQIQLMA
jgi:hypothetical protein